MAEAGRRKRQQKDNGTTVDGAKILLGIGAIIAAIGIGAVVFWVAGQRSGPAIARQPVAREQPQAQPVKPEVQEVQPQIQQAQQPQVQAVPTQTQEAQPQVQPVLTEVQPTPESQSRRPERRPELVEGPVEGLVEGPVEGTPQSQPQAAAAEETSLRQAQDDAADLAPDLTLATLDGEFQLSQKRGNVVILYFTFVG